MRKKGTSKGESEIRGPEGVSFPLPPPSLSLFQLNAVKSYITDKGVCCIYVGSPVQCTLHCVVRKKKSGNTATRARNPPVLTWKLPHKVSKHCSSCFLLASFIRLTFQGCRSKDFFAALSLWLTHCRKHEKKKCNGSCTPPSLSVSFPLAHVWHTD